MSSERAHREFQIMPTFMVRPPLDPTHTALVVVDMVNWNVPREAGAGGMAPGYIVERFADVVIPNLQRLVETCRDAGVRVVFLRIGCSRPDYSDALPVLRTAFAEYGAVDGSQACEVIPELSPQEGDLSLLKTGSGGFTSSALDSHLRNMGIKQVIYTGVATNGCVMVSALAGFDLGYYGYLVSDATAALTQEFQQQAESLIGAVYARLVTTEEMLSVISAFDRGRPAGVG